MGTLYLVATPIGNLEDISARALRILKEVTLIAAEDTRHTRVLLNHYDINKRTESYHEHNKLKKVAKILSALDSGDVALVSDAGTPGLNDPGYELIQAALDAGHEVSPIPGPSAPIAALVASGLETNAFTYLGYLPRKPGDRERYLERINDLPFTLIFLESPHRLLAALNDLKTYLGDRKIAIGRELTKIHEEFFRGTINTAIEHFSNREPRGEFTVVVEGYRRESEIWSAAKVRASIIRLIGQDMPATQIARQIARKSCWPRREVYQLVIEMKKENDL
ncbi:MAG: 16S rRNA (cytidine(1402)-2'-O)-methyltransferase [Anaerolineales bacterium]|jgi:16S rRNA (cytidine1402-2'-O)-methyltransferase